MTKSIHMLDYGLNGLAGHDFNYDASLRSACRKMQVPFQLYVCKKLSEEIRGALDAVPLFTSFWLDFPWTNEPHELLRRLSAFNLEFCGDLAGLSDRIDRDSVVFVQSIRVDRLVGLQMWLTALPPEKRPEVVIFLRYDMAEDPLFQGTFRCLSELRLRLRFCTDTSDLQQAYDRIGCPVDVVPIPHTAPSNGEAPPAVDPAIKAFLMTGGGPILAYFGPARENKGFHLLPEIMGHVLDLDPAARFLVQSPRTDQGRILDKSNHVLDAFGKLLGLAEASENILWIDKAVDDEEYRYLMSRSDIVLLPYIGSQYRMSSSGIYSEAVAAGKVTVLPKGTWMERQARQHDTASVVFGGHSAADVALAVAKVFARLGALQKQAADIAPTWAAHHSPEAFIQYLLS